LKEYFVGGQILTTAVAPNTTVVPAVYIVYEPKQRLKASGVTDNLKEHWNVRQQEGNKGCKHLTSIQRRRKEGGAEMHCEWECNFCLLITRRSYNKSKKDL